MKSTLLVSEWVGGVGGDGVGWRVCMCAVAFSVGGTVMCGLCLGREVSVCTHDHTVLLGILCVCVSLW